MPESLKDWEAENLEKCPLCGGTCGIDEYLTWDGYDEKGKLKFKKDEFQYCPGCSQCGTEVFPNSMFSSYEEACTEWNNWVQNVVKSCAKRYKERSKTQ